MEQAADRSLIVYLRTRAAEAARRVGAGRDRPLLAGADPEERMRELLGARESFYRRAEVTVDTNDRTAEQVADEVVKLARSRGGW
jgi:shikimate kinase